MPRKCKNVLDTAIAREQSTSVPELPDNQYVLEMSSSTQYQDACRDRHLEQIFNMCIEQGVLPLREGPGGFMQFCKTAAPHQIALLLAKYINAGVFTLKGEPPGGASFKAILGHLTRKFEKQFGREDLDFKKMMPFQVLEFDDEISFNTTYMETQVKQAEKMVAVLRARNHKITSEKAELSQAKNLAENAVKTRKAENKVLRDKNTKLEALIEEFKMDSRADALLLAQKNDEINQLKIKLKN